MKSRMLYALAREHQAPGFFLSKNRWGVPWASLLVSGLSAFLAYAIFNLKVYTVHPDQFYVSLIEGVCLFGSGSPHMESSSLGDDMRNIPPFPSGHESTGYKASHSQRSSFTIAARFSRIRSSRFLNPWFRPPAV